MRPLMFYLGVLITSVLGTPTAAQEWATQASELQRRADDLAQRKRHADAVPLVRRALQIYEKEEKPEGAGVAHTLLELSSLYGELKRWSEAEAAVKRALRVYEELERADPSNAASEMGMYLALDKLGGLYESQERYAEAEANYVESLSWSRSHNLSMSPGSLALLYITWGRALASQGHLAEAEAKYKKSIAVHPPTSLPARLGLADLYRSQGRTVEAERILQSERK